MHILIAPNAFKNSLTATEACKAIANGLEQSTLPCTLQCFPIGDGGDGTAELIVKNANGIFEELTAMDPLFRKIKTSIGYIDFHQTAVIELAEISGLKLLQEQEKDPMRATSFGTGELIRKALDEGARKIILCIGGSATVDGGSGILQALGIRFLDKSGKELTDLPQNLIHLETIDSSALDKRVRDTELIILCDVNNFLLGDQGAASIFGPQKGASINEVMHLEKALGKFRDVTLLQMGKDMQLIHQGGAAGGVAAGLHVYLQARLVNGIEYFLDMTCFDEALSQAQLVITGEGSIDLQTLEGKGPFGVACRARQKSIPVIGMAGQIPLEPDSRLQEYFDVLMAIGNQPEEIKTALFQTRENLQRTSRQVGRLLAVHFQTLK
jgi:glycerate 2-kinase